MTKQKLRLGTVAFSPKGKWNAETEYKRLNVVHFLASSYYAKKDNVGQTPTLDSEYWGLLVEGGDVVNNPDEEDITTEVVNNEHVLKLADKEYRPENYSGKGYKRLRKNIQKINLAVTKITVNSAPTKDGEISVTINNIDTHISLVKDTHNTPAIVAQTISDALVSAHTDYNIEVTENIITLTRKHSGEVSSSAFDVADTGVTLVIEDSTKSAKRNILTPAMINQPNTIYEIRYDFDLNGETINIPENCVLKFEGGSFNNGDLNVKYSNVTIQGPAGFENVQIFANNTNCHILDIDIVNESKHGIYSNSGNGCSGLTIKNCKIVSKGGQCIKVVADNTVEHIQNITIEGCYLQFYIMGIEFQSHVENSSYIENCIISNNKIKLYDPDSYEHGFGISLSGWGNNVLVEKNEISSCRLGIENPGFSGTRIINNVITGIATSTRLLAFSNRNSDKAYISGNAFNTGVIYIDLGVGTFFTNNNCYVNEVRFRSSSDCKIMGNIIVYDYTGIFFDNTSGSYIDNNYIYTSSDKGEAAIHFYGENSTNNRVLNCHFLKSNPNYGVMIQNSNGATGNIIYSYINENSKSTYYPEFTTQFTTINNKITAIDTVYTTSSDYKPLDAQRIKNFYFHKDHSVEEAVFSIRVPKTQVSVYFMFHVFADCGADNTNFGVYEFIIDRVAFSASDVGINLKRIRNIPNIRYEYSSDDNYLYFNVILVGTSGNRGLNLYVLEGTSNTDNICINLKERTAVYTKETDGSGTSEQRPSNIPNNYQYFDTTLEKPIWWTGTKWVDATGADI